ncbi:MAG: YwaF family protein [Erysipelotrichaceae bacterium]|nr:YwaF family protein [Erysipelotrichaceae bacterium]
MGICFKETPELFGMLHISALLVIILFNCGLCFLLKDRKEAQLIRILHRTGLFMMLAEVFKQWFCYVHVFDKTVNLWFFPWQLCSMAMYCAFAVRYLPERRQNSFLVFLASFSLFTDVIALILPYDMLRDQIVLFVHSFAYHGLIISCAIISLFVLKKRQDIRFLPSIYLFLSMALIAFIINIVSHAILHDIYREPNMFYITLSYPTTQPVFHEIALRFSIPVEIFSYLSFIILFSGLLFWIEKRFFLGS